MSVDASEVVAIVLTFDAPDAIARCLSAIADQTCPPGRVVVVDNHSDPPVQPPESAPSRVEVLRTSHNGGPAGGHAAGFERFLEIGARFAWVMDDDCVPRPDCLERLLTGVADTGPQLVFPSWFDVAVGRVRNFPAWNGFVISREAVELVGIPRSDFVWWAEDTEYLQWRMHVAGIRPSRVGSAVVDHVRLPGTRAPWKVYYEARNTVYFRLHVQRRPFRRFRRLARSLVRMGGQILLRDDHKLSRAWLFVRGVFDGLVGRLGLRVALSARSDAGSP